MTKVSLRQAVFDLYKKDKEITLEELKEKFPKANETYLGQLLSKARSYIGKGDGDDRKPIEKISMEILEPLIAKKLQHNPTNQDLKLAVEILKIKQQDTGLMNEIDLDKFYKIGVNDQENDV